MINTVPSSLLSMLSFIKCIRLMWCVCICVCRRERYRGRDKDRERKTDRDRDASGSPDWSWTDKPASPPWVLGFQAYTTIFRLEHVFCCVVLPVPQNQLLSQGNSLFTFVATEPSTKPRREEDRLLSEGSTKWYWLKRLMNIYLTVTMFQTTSKVLAVQSESEPSGTL